MAQPWQQMFDAVRKKCAPNVWSQGVELSRSDAVTCDSVDEDEAVFRIATMGGMVSKAVTLYLDDFDWDCECDSEAHGCVHAAAAVIVWRRREESGESVEAPSTRAASMNSECLSDSTCPRTTRAMVSQ